MERILRIAIVAVVVVFFGNYVYGQVTLGTSPYTQDFNSLASGLPVGWSVRTAAAAGSLGAITNPATPFSTTTTWSTSTGNFRNVASATGLTSGATTADQNSAANRALAVRQTGSFGDPGAAFVFQLSNTTGLSNLSLAFKLQSLDGGTAARTATWKVDYGIGANPTSFVAMTTSPSILTTTLSPAGWGSQDITVSFGTALDNISSNVWIRIVTLSATTGGGNRPTSAIDDVQLSYVAGDFSAPSFTSSFPKISNYTYTGFDLTASINEPGAVYYVVVPDGAAAPTSIQVKNGQDATGSSVTTGFAGSISLTSSGVSNFATLSVLNSGTDYDVYLATEDNIPNLQTSPTKVDVRTNTVGDVTSPNFIATYPNASLITASGLTLKASLDELGKAYVVIVPGGAPAPTSTQVKNHQDGNSVVLATNLYGVFNAELSNTELTLPITGLTANTAYDIYLATEDFIPNLQLSPTKISITTLKLFTEAFNNCDGTASFSSFSVTGDQVWGCVDFGYNSTKGLRMNGFGSAAVANEDWLISPGLTLSAAAALSFYSQFSFAGNALQLKISTDYSGTGDPAAATWVNLNGQFPTVAVGSTSVALTDWTLSNVDLSAYASQKVFIAFVYTSTSAAAARWTLDEINVTSGVPSYLTLTPSGLNFSLGGTVKNYTLKGTNLINDVTVTAPTDFQISKDNATFGSSVLYTAAEANANATVYVKFVGTGSGNYTGSITHTSTGVATKSVAVTGIDKSKSFNITAYNLEFFGSNVADGSGEYGPVDDALQVTNVTTVMQTIGSDIFSVEEVSDDPSMDQLVANLPGYDKLMADRWSYSFNPPDPTFPPQKIGIVYKTSSVHVVSSRVMFSKLYDDIRAAESTGGTAASLALLPGYPSSGGNTPSNFWSSGRLPFMVTADVTINSFTKRIKIVVLHSKSGSAQADYDRRKYDVQLLHDSLVTNYPNDNIIILGDFNDDVDASINTGSPSSYKMFVDDAANFSVLTYAISQAGAFSFPSSSSFLDHIIISNELTSDYVTNSILVEDPRTYIAGYTATTSDHLPVSARFVLAKASQTITFNTLPAKTFGNANFALTATTTSGLPITYASSDPTIASINGNTVSILKSGTVDITASQAGNASYLAASAVTRQLVISKASQTITFATLANKKVGDAAFDLTATSSSALAISYTSSDPAVASIVGKTVTIIKAGTISITASQAGDEKYAAANDVLQQLVISSPAKTDQTITFVAIPAKTLGDAAFTLAATSTSTLAVSFSTTSDKITLTGSQVTLTKAGSVTIKASQAGSASFNAATSVDQTFCVNPAKPAITLSGLNTESPVLTSSSSTGNQWYLNNNAIAGAIGATYSATSAGIYKVQVKADNCASAFSNDTPLIVTGDLKTVRENMSVYPNPVEDYLTILGLNGDVTECSVSDVTGRTITLKLERQHEAHRADVRDFGTGMYIVRVQSANSIQQIKFIKK